MRKKNTGQCDHDTILLLVPCLQETSAYWSDIHHPNVATDDQKSRSLDPSRSSHLMRRQVNIKFAFPTLQFFNILFNVTLSAAAVTIIMINNCDIKKTFIDRVK